MTSSVISGKRKASRFKPSRFQEEYPIDKRERISNLDLDDTLKANDTNGNYPQKRKASRFKPSRFQEDIPVEKRDRMEIDIECYVNNDPFSFLLYPYDPSDQYNTNTNSVGLTMHNDTFIDRLIYDDTNNYVNQSTYELVKPDEVFGTPLEYEFLSLMRMRMIIMIRRMLMMIPWIWIFVVAFYPYNDR